MKIIIVGLGDAGMALAARISEENHEVVVIDKDPKVIAYATEHYNVNGVVGSGGSRNILMQAGAETADLLIALTPVDEMNIFACITAKKCGVPYTIAHVSRPEFDQDADYITEEYKVDELLNAEKETAIEIQKQITMPGALQVEAFFNDKVVMTEWEVDAHSPLVGMSMPQMKQFFQNDRSVDLVVATVTNGDKVVIPDGSYQIEEGDVLGILIPSRSEVIREVFGKLRIKQNPVRSILMVGCRTTGYYLAERLCGKYSVKILDNDRNNCIALAKRFPRAEVVCGDAVDTEVLREEGIGKADVCVSLTGDDRINLAVSMYACAQRTGQVIVKLNEMNYGQLLRKSNIDVAISPSEVLVERVLSLVRNQSSTDHSRIKQLFRVADGKAEVIEFEVSEGCPNLNVPFKSPQFCTKKGTLVAAIIRGEEVIIPNGDSHIEVGDLVVVVNRKNHVSDLEDIFVKK